mgnify:CR=1 FL=1
MLAFAGLKAWFILIKNIQWYSIKEVSELFGLCEKTIRSFEKEGLKFHRIGRSVRISDVEIERFFFGTKDNDLIY